MCAECLVRAECLEYALALDVNTAGIWGGLSGRERRQQRRARQLGH